MNIEVVHAIYVIIAILLQKFNMVQVISAPISERISSEKDESLSKTGLLSLVMGGEPKNIAVGVEEIPERIHNAGIAGAGGAGFPAYAKWQWLDQVDHLLVNHQESEPNFFKDKWLGRRYAARFAALFGFLLNADVFQSIVVSAKLTDRTDWMANLEAETGGTIYTPEDLPLEPEAVSGVSFAYTENQYEYGMEGLLLRLVADIVIGTGLPMEYGWIVQNTETLFNIHQALVDDAPVTEKYVHVDGATPHHRFLKVPVGTLATDLLEASELSTTQLDERYLLADGGPGWCFEIRAPLEAFGVRKRTNCMMILDTDIARTHTLGGGRINVLGEYKRKKYETEPTTTLTPERVRIPLVTNDGFPGIVFPSEPIVEPGEGVKRGEPIAMPVSDGFSNVQHASIGGTVTRVTETHIEIHKSDENDSTDKVDKTT